MITFIRRKIDSFGIGQDATKRCIIDDITIHQLISEQDWDAVERLLGRTSKSRIKNDLILHFALQFDPPLRIVRALSTNCPSSHATDGKGRYPIHIAVASGCDPDVIRFLIRLNPASAGAQDQTGCSPMHYAGKCYAKNYADSRFDSPLDHIDEVCRSTHLVVELLAKAAIQTINVEDENEMNPIEYALLSATNMKVIKMMQRASRKDWRKRNMKDQERDTAQGGSPTSEMQKSFEDLFKGMYDKSAEDVEFEPLFTSRHKRGTVPLRTD